MTTVAARYDVSSSFLARVCKRLNVPRPPRGYWAKLAVGKKIPKPSLPPPRPGDETEWLRDGEPPRSPRALPKPPEPNTRTQTRVRKERPTIHELIVGAKRHFDEAKVTEAGYLRPSKRRLVDLFVTKKTLVHALDFANHLFLALEDRGYSVKHPPFGEHLGRPEVDERLEKRGSRYGFETWRPDRPTVAYFGTLAIGLSIFELSKTTEVKYVGGKYIPVTELPTRHRRSFTHEWTTQRDLPTGRICLRATSPYYRAPWEAHWQEETAGDLPAKVAKIIKVIEAAIPGIAEKVEEAERQAELERQRWEAKQREWEREEAERKRVENIKTSRKELFEVIQSWGEARQIEGFFEDAERRTEELTPNEQLILRERLRMARELLGGVDALRRFLSWKAPNER